MNQKLDIKQLLNMIEKSNINTIEYSTEKAIREAKLYGVDIKFIKYWFNSNLLYRIARFKKSAKRQNKTEEFVVSYINQHIKPPYYAEVLSKKRFIIIGHKIIENPSSTDLSNANCKTIDIRISVNKYTIFIYHKYTDGHGGSQDNQYKDLIEFMRVAQNVADESVIFIVLVDGDYYSDTKINRLKHLQTPFVKIYRTTEFVEYHLNPMIDTMEVDEK